MMSRMVEVVIDSVRVSLTNQQRVVVLREVGAERYLPIWIGPFEAEAITIALQEIEVARPQTHDLLKNMIKAFNARLVRVEVVSLREDVFYGSLIVEQDGNLITVDARPSDALALAVRTHVPILVDAGVLDSAGIIPEEDVKSAETADAEEEKPEEPAAESREDEPTPGESRLSVFEDFLQGLDLGGDLDDDEQPDEPDDKKPDPQA